jgi:hypothetical protein
MDLQRAIQQVLQDLPEERLREVLDFACFIAQRRESEDWQAFGRMQLARAYGPDEPEYTEADLKLEHDS